MISEQEVKDLSIDLGVPLPNVEKDYVMGWLLWSIYNDHRLGNRLVLKGGNCLRKVYFPDTRFSDDLDFTALQLDSESVFRARLADVLSRVHDASGIKFDLDRTIVKEKETPDQESKALDARVYFHGFAGDSNVTM
jgi:predicted nucleotidyltransferase component of viral defense system